MTLELSYESDNKNFHKEISFPYEMTSPMFDEIVRQLTAAAMRVHQTIEGVTTAENINSTTLNRPEVFEAKGLAIPTEEEVAAPKKKHEGKNHD